MKSAGIYLHIPFCTVKCIYCDFYSITDIENLIPTFIKAIVQEIKECRIDVSDWIIDTIFIGGGTPSLLSENMIESILSQLHKKYDLSNIREITIEANPGEAPKGRLKSFYAMGINRISIGAQSFQTNLLQFLTRIHNRDLIFETYDNARDAGFDNINCDLIYSIPGQTWPNWNDDLDIISAMSPEHISAYALTAEKGTELFSMISNGKVKMPKKKQEGDWFHKTHKILSQNGYQAYEVSSFSKPGYECSHNLHYWNIEPYLAFGPSAHGFDGQYRWNNFSSLNQYTNCILSGKSAISKRERISSKDLVNEKIGFGLRMKKGFELKNIPFRYQASVEDNFRNVKRKYPDCIRIQDKNITFTKKGMLYADELIPILLL